MKQLKIYLDAPKKYVDTVSAEISELHVGKGGASVLVIKHEPKMPIFLITAPMELKEIKAGGKTKLVPIYAGLDVSGGYSSNALKLLKEPPVLDVANLPGNITVVVRADDVKALNTATKLVLSLAKKYNCNTVNIEQS